MVIDPHGTAVLTNPAKGAERTLQETGYVWVDGPKVQIIFTDRTNWHGRLDHYYCSIESTDLLSCRDGGGKATGPAFFVKRQP